MTNVSHHPNIVSIYKNFHDAMDKQGFLPLIRSASILFDAPIVFTDERYHLISQFPQNKIGDFVYDTLLETGTLPIDTITAFQEAYLTEPGSRYEPFFEKDGLVRNLPRIFAEIYDDEKILGHIAVFIGDIERKAWILEAVSVLTTVLRIKLNLTKHSTPTLSKNLNNLLDRTSSRQLKDKSVSSLLQTCSNPGILLVAPIDQNKAQQAFASVALNYCSLNFPSTISTIFNNDLVIFVTDKNKPSLASLQKIAKKIAVFLFRYKVTCSGVYPVNNFYLLPDYYLQGRFSALLKIREDNLNIISKTDNSNIEKKEFQLAYYDQLMPEPLFLYLSESPGISSFIHPVLGILKKYDEENATEFFPTLKCYCHCLLQKNETSEILHIHRNTLLYRLNRIEELFSLNLNNYEILHHLIISFELEKYDG